MTDSESDSLLSFTGVGGLALVGGIACCMGLKLVGGAVLFGGIAAVFGITRDQMTFVVGGFAGLLLGALLLGYRRYQRHGSVT